MEEAPMVPTSDGHRGGAAQTDPSFSVVAPNVELPKGGGAIRGIGEKFAANPVTGTGTMSVPIAASSGRSGFGPELLLSYDSGAGNGPFGFGWSLNTPQIARTTDRGLPRYQDAEESDVFLLSGAEDLVPLLINGKRHADSASVPGYTIRRYRPRIEGLFARIERWTKDSDGDTHWRSISGDNVLTLYGFLPADRIADPSDPSRIFTWLISEIRDDKGNAVIYSYRQDGANTYLKRIHYGNRLSRLGVDRRRPLFLDERRAEATDWNFELVFDYGDHDAENPTPRESHPWPSRSDSFSNRRAGFEVRTSRRCERVLMFHHFAELAMPSGCLVRSTDFHYDDGAIYSFLTSVTHKGWRHTGSSYVTQSMPPVEFEYSQPRVGDEVKVADTSDGLPMGIDGTTYRMVDLDGYGAAGVLTEQSGSWYYSRNISPLNLGEVAFAPPLPVPSRPSLALGASGAQFLDLAGDGLLDLAILDPPMPGFYELDPLTGWAPFQPIMHALHRDLSDPHVKFIDITGDGLADVLIIDDDVVWHESLGKEGFGPGNKVWQKLEREQRPRLVFADPTSAIFLADMTGDGLTDLVQIGNSRVCYWPSLGYGAFGQRVTMGDVLLDSSDRFDPARVLLADIDGSGTSDVIYVGGDGVDLYFNACGNTLSAPTRLEVFPQVSSGTRVSTMDLMGDGTACLVWSSSLPTDAAAPLRYVELMADGKPHLMIGTCNNLGAQTRIHYSTSGAMALRDELVGKPWRTRVSFPVHVVGEVVTIDHLSGNRFTSSYRYRDGYFDGPEREFRGFARVDQLDTEMISALRSTTDSDVASNENIVSNVPPVLTRTWFHTGAMPGDARLTRALEDEYFSYPGFDDWRVEDTVLPTVPPGEPLSNAEVREAVRSLKGSVLRTEVYALDTPDTTIDEPGIPYVVTEQNMQIVCLQRQGEAKNAVFFTHPRETISHHLERNPEDPRTAHTFILDVDEYGNVLREASVGYGRRPSTAGVVQTEPGMEPEDRAKQQLIHVTVTNRRLTKALVNETSHYRTPLPAEEITYELRTAMQEKMGDPGLAFPVTIDGLRERIDAAGDGEHDVTYEDLGFVQAAEKVKNEPSYGTHYFRRVIEHLRTLYRADDLHLTNDRTGLLPCGTAEPRALPGESYKLAFTAGLLDDVFQRDGQPLLPNAADVLPQEGGYVADKDGQWWISSGRTFFSSDETATPDEELALATNNFFLPVRYRDPFGNSTIVQLDENKLFVVSSRDPLGNLVTVETKDDDGVAALRFDYRTLQPYWVTDPNGNRTRVAFDTFGFVVATAVMGKPGENDGDLLSDGFDVDLTQLQLDAVHDVVVEPETLLGSASTRIVYDVFRFIRSVSEHPNDPTLWQPTFAVVIARETHVSDAAGQGTRLQVSFSYSDGLGREIQKKVQAEPGPLDVNDPQSPAVGPRWVGSGWTVFNNKGKPVRQYEPFFSGTHHYEAEVKVGVSPVLFYDPLDRPIATLHPNHTFEKVVFDPWQQTTYDVNDTCASRKLPEGALPSRVTGDPRTDPDIGGYVAGYFATQPAAWQTWHALRVSGGMGTDEKNAALRAAAHADTPTTAYFDALGRPFLTVTRNRVDCLQHDLHGTEDHVASRVELDIEGNQCAIRDAVVQAGDPLGRIVMRYTYDMLGNRVHQINMEAGSRWMLNDVAGKPIRAWDSRGHNFTISYDELRRPVLQTVRGTLPGESDPRTLGADVVVDKIEYGEILDNSEVLNLRTRVYRHFDSSGVATNARFGADGQLGEAYDFKGNLLCSTRSLVRDYKAMPDWSQNPQLEDESFEAHTRYDALNRPVQSVAPRSSLGRGGFNVVQPVFNEANLLERLDVWLEQPERPDKLIDGRVEPASAVGVGNIDYDAKGQRLRIDYKNGASTFYGYDELTSRLTTLITKRRATDFPGDDPNPPVEGWPGRYLQNLSYTYDPAGNITHIRDAAQQTIFFRNMRVEPSNDYVYDALYRLIQATGREHLGVNGASVVHSRDDAGRVGLQSSDGVGNFAPNDTKAMANYIERYTYDAVGNFLQMKHVGSDSTLPGWTRAYTYGEASLIEGGTGGASLKQSNRLSSTTANLSRDVPRETRYAYDAHGNMLLLPDVRDGSEDPNMHWDYRDRLRQVDLLGENVAHYVYDASGERVRKIWKKTDGLIEERIYLGGFEIFREHHAPSIGPGTATLERETLHVMDDTQRIAIVESRTLDVRGVDKAPQQLVRYQVGNHLGSASLEVDDRALVISYEEYAPYGSSTYQAVRSLTECPKRYRYTGKERDEETGLSYHGARYYAPWLGRWTSADPAFDYNYSAYCYARCRSALLRDDDGHDPVLPPVVGSPPVDCRGNKCHTSYPSATRGWTGNWRDVGVGAVKSFKNLAVDVLQSAAVMQKPLTLPANYVLEATETIEEQRPAPPKNDSEWLGFFAAETISGLAFGPETAMAGAEETVLKQVATAERLPSSIARTELTSAAKAAGRRSMELERRAVKELERLEGQKVSAGKHFKFTGRFKRFTAKPFLVPTALQEQVRRLHSVLDKIAQSRKTTALAIVDTSNGLKIVVASSDKLVPRAIRELAKQEGMEILEGTGHAEATILNEVTKRGWNLKAIAPSRDFCANCWSRSLATDAEIMGVLKDRAFSGKKK